ncbi:hypothetical protein B0T22DRAFT_371950 [Podospora appendiculata]|uniref:Copper acquisition factor BIM1-like domain-containing protein n=1 Tax=Podospora appendiculata TaxID=314037 RepID=A0AAE0XH74_9PEZI|nr:hypothetical protein B0T22DRAFT_371950 [Podospora appendiculata]
MAVKAFLLLALAHLAAAHFGVEYPTWRANTLLANTTYNQWVYPCAGVPSNLTDSPRTDWPIAGGSVKLDLHHKWTYVFLNLGLGSEVTNFNYSLTPEFWNVTGNGTLCVPKLALPAELTPADGTNATIQVVTSGASGSALYNCADITFRSGASALSSGDCATDAGITYVPIKQQATNSSATTATPKGNGATIAGVNMAALSLVMGLAVLLA